LSFAIRKSTQANCKDISNVLFEYILLYLCACSFASGECREEAAVHFAWRLKIYCTPTSFSEFMACKVEASRSMWLRPCYATYRRFLLFLLNPKREFSEEEATDHWIYRREYQTRCVTRFASDKSCFPGYYRIPSCFPGKSR